MKTRNVPPPLLPTTGQLVHTGREQKVKTPSFEPHIMMVNEKRRRKKKKRSRKKKKKTRRKKMRKKKMRKKK